MSHSEGKHPPGYPAKCVYISTVKHCPKCNWELGDALREGQQTRCPKCGFEIVVHYTLKEQLRDPMRLLLRDPKYISKKSQLITILVIILLVVFFMTLMVWSGLWGTANS